MTKSHEMYKIEENTQLSQTNWFVLANELVEYFLNTSIATYTEAHRRLTPRYCI